jgi:hypothetical protein
MASHVRGLFKQWRRGSLNISFTVSQLQPTPKTEPGEDFNAPANARQGGSGKAFIAIWQTFLAKHITQESYKHV